MKKFSYMNRIIRPLSALVPILLMCGCGDTSDNQNATKLHSVYTTVPLSENATVTRSYTSSVEEGKSVNASFKTGGQIKKLTVNEGDYVKSGQIIGYLDDADYRLSVQQLEAQYNQMSSEMTRLDEMFRRNNVAPNDYEKAQSGLEQLRTQLEMTRNKLAYTQLESPTSGYVVERFMEEGEMAGSGTPVYKIIDNSSMETSVALPASVYGRRDDITGCTGSSPALGNIEIPLETIGFVPDADNNSLFRLRLRIPSSMNGQLLPGMNLSVTLRFDNSGGDGNHTVPSRSIFERNGKEYVWVINQSDSTLSAREVTVTDTHSGKNSTVSGLNGDETIVAVGVHHLTEGEKVKVMGDIDTIEK